MNISKMRLSTIFLSEVLQDDGSVAVVDRTLYKSKYGWMLNVLNLCHKQLILPFEMPTKEI